MQTIYKNSKMLKMGYTTGSCAAAAAKAASILLLTGNIPEKISLITPKGIKLILTPEKVHLTENCASCSIKKDSGDDPDVTNGIYITAVAEKIESGIIIEGGKGIGRVTRKGLACPVGSAAINPAPLRQIKKAVQQIIDKYNYKKGILITISAENGEEIAKKTYNPHLGIEGGISILGTSGIVEPMSENALIQTIHLELKSLKEEGSKIAFLCPGNYGTDFAKEKLGLDLSRSVKCSNYIGDALDYSAFIGFKNIFLVGHAGKLVKLAAGVMNTHSSVADARQEIFTSHAAICGASQNCLKSLMKSITTDECLDILKAENIDKQVLNSIGKAICNKLEKRLNEKAKAEFIMFTNDYGILYQSKGAKKLCEELVNR